MSESTAILVLTCTCGQKMKIPEESIGRTFKCVRCGEHMKSSEENAIAAVSSPPPPVNRTANTPAEADATDTPAAQEPIGQLLINAGVITEEQLQDALSKQKSQGGKTFELLIALGYLDKEKLHDFLSRQPGIAAIDLSRFDIAPDLIKLVPKKIAVDNLVLPIDQLGKLLTVAMACPLDVGTIATLEKLTGLRVKAMLCKLEDIHGAVQKYYPDRSRVDLSPSSFDNILGASEGPKEKIDEKLASWVGVYMSESQLKALRAGVADEKSLDGIARRVLEEPSLSAFVMRVANSDIYGMPGQIESVPMAVAVLGRPGVTGLLEKLIKPVSPKIMEPLLPLQAKFRLTAVIAQGLARESGAMGEHAAYSLGLISELGRLAMASLSPVKYKRVKGHLYGPELSVAEHKLYTMDHAMVAGTIAESWRFPSHVIKALRHYSEPQEAKGVEGLAALLYLAIALSYSTPESLNGVLKSHGETIAQLKMTPQIVERLVEDGRASLAPKTEKA